jgi:hypothetical protein
MKKYHIRYNTKHGDSDLVWRIFEDGKQYLVRDFLLTVPVFGEKTIEDGLEKWNVACYGKLKIVDDIASIEMYK